MSEAGGSTQGGFRSHEGQDTSCWAVCEGEQFLPIHTLVLQWCHINTTFLGGSMHDQGHTGSYSNSGHLCHRQLWNLQLKLFFFHWDGVQINLEISCLCSTGCLYLNVSNFVPPDVWDSFLVNTAGSLQEPAGPQEHRGEALSLDEVVQEPASEWQALANVFWHRPSLRALSEWSVEKSRALGISVLKRQVLKNVTTEFFFFLSYKII